MIFRRGIDRARDLGFSPELLQQAFWDTLGSKSPFAVFCAKIRFGLEALTMRSKIRTAFGTTSEFRGNANLL